MKVLVCVSGGQLSTALLGKMMEDGHKVHAFWVDFGADTDPVRLCRDHGVEIIQVDLDGFGSKMPEDGHFPGRNGVILSMALSFASAWEYDAVAVGFCRQHEYSDAEYHYLSLVEATIGLLGLKVMLLRPFATWSRDEVLRLLGTPEEAHKPRKPAPPVCFSVLKCPNKAVSEGGVTRETVHIEHVTCPECLDKMDLDRGENEHPELEANPELPEFSHHLPEAGRYEGPLRPFIFSAEGVYGYVNDKTSFEAVVNQMGGLRAVLDSRAELSSSSDAGPPTFTPDGIGDTVEEWLGTSLDGLVETSHLTRPGGGGHHNPGHQGCC